jgi:hypothetical protein
MTESKFVLKSRTILSALVAIAGLANALAAKLGVVLPSWLAYINQTNADLVASIIATAAVMYFRVVATQELTVVPVSSGDAPAA